MNGLPIVAGTANTGLRAATVATPVRSATTVQVVAQQQLQQRNTVISFLSQTIHIVKVGAIWTYQTLFSETSLKVALIASLVYASWNSYFGVHTNTIANVAGTAILAVQIAKVMDVVAGEWTPLKQNFQDFEDAHPWFKNSISPCLPFISFGVGFWIADSRPGQSLILLVGSIAYYALKKRAP